MAPASPDIASNIERFINTELPQFSDKLPNLYIPFSVRRFRNAKVLWLNTRWFASFGIDVSDEDVRLTLDRWLLARYGVSALNEDDDVEQFEGVDHHLFADRYGEASGSTHGGSGRVGTFGLFNAKGIGRTPLVSKDSDWYHTHGCMFIEEAIREAIISEIAVGVFPSPSVPTIAVIDSGSRLRWRDGSFGDRRAVIVRPCFLRLSSFMRSIYFGNSGVVGSAQYIDARNVDDIWAEFGSDIAKRCFSNVGIQYGYGNALRLWPGPMFASNFTMDGGLVDFGSFRALPNWSKARGESRAHSFGGELALALPSAQSLARNALRCGITLNPSELIDGFKKGSSSGFDAALAHYGSVLDGLDRRTLYDVIRTQRRYSTGITGGDLDSFEIGRIKPSPLLYRESIQSSIELMLSEFNFDEALTASVVGDFVDRYIGKIKSALLVG